MSLFVPGWRDEVRDFLRPFKRPCQTPIEAEESFDRNCYLLDAGDFVAISRRGTRGSYLLSDKVLHWQDTGQYGAEETAEIVWASKKEFVSPLCFWAATELISNLSTLESCLDFRVERTVCPQFSRSVNLLEYQRGFWPHAEPFPAEFKRERILGIWCLRNEWNDSSQLFEMDDYFLLWNWMTSA